MGAVNRPRPRARRGPVPRLTDRQARTIRERAADGTPLVQLAEAYQVSLSHVSNIVRGRKYPHAGGPIRTGYQTKNTEA